MTQVRTDELAKFAAGLRVSDVPEMTRKTVKDHVLDTVGVQLACAGLHYMQILEKVSSPLAGGPRVLGSATTYAASTAALLTVSLSHDTVVRPYARDSSPTGG